MEKLSLEQLDGVCVSGWDAMEAFGIRALTSEACAYGVRVLCDANQQGLDLLRDYLGVPALLLCEPLNSKVGDTETVGSIMLERHAWRSLARFAAFRLGALAVCENPLETTVIARVETLRAYERAQLTEHLVRNTALPEGPLRQGSRNVHQMTGRVL